MELPINKLHMSIFYMYLIASVCTAACT